MKLAIWIVILFTSFVASAVQLDRETHDALIAKLEGVRENLTPSDLSYAPTCIRIADLLADRARLGDMANQEGKTSNPEQAKQDRIRALSLLSGVVGLVRDEQRARVELQMAQLLQLTGQNDQATKLLHRVRKTAAKGSDEYWVSTDLLADMAFSQGQYPQARRYYDEMLKSNKNVQFVTYRLAWCDLNQAQEAKAVQRLEALLARQDLNEGLRKEATHDLVIFYARQPFSEAHVAKIKAYSATSETDAQENLRSYAEELKRLGRKRESAFVFIQYFGTNPKDSDLLAQADLFENLVDVGQRQEALKILEKIVSQKCRELCSDVQVRINRALRGWAAEQKRKAGTNLLAAFEMYARQQPLDQNALLLGIATAQESKRHVEALRLLSVLVLETKDPKVLETALKAQVASAEKIKQPSLREMAYRSYLKQGTDLDIRRHAMISLVTTLAEQKKFGEAEELGMAEFSRKFDADLGDELLGVFQKSGQTEKERQLSLTMARGNYRSKYFNEYKRLTILGVHNRMKSESASQADIQTLVELAPRALTPTEHFRILNDAYLVALQIEDFAHLKTIADKMVELRGLKRNERQLALEKRVFVADLELDFGTSLQFDKQLSEGSSPAKTFRLALKARLSHHPDYRAESKILASRAASTEQKLWIIEQQVLRDENPLATLRKHRSVLARHPEAHSRLFLMAMGRGAADSQAGSYLKSNRSLRGTLAGTLIQRRERLTDLRGLNKRLQTGQIAVRSMQKFDKSLNRFLADLTQLERRFVSDSDAVIAMIAHSHWEMASRRLYEGLMAAHAQLPVPAKMRAGFQKQLVYQMTNLRERIAKSESQLAHQWANQKIESQLDKLLIGAHPLQKKALVEEIARWRAASGTNLQESWASVLRRIGESSEGSQAADLRPLYVELKRNPFRRELAQKLAKAEASQGNRLLANFLSERQRVGGL